jgi:hypothetical protein
MHLADRTVTALRAVLAKMITGYIQLWVYRKAFVLSRPTTVNSSSPHVWLTFPRPECATVLNPPTLDYIHHFRDRLLGRDDTLYFPRYVDVRHITIAG